MIDFSWDCLFSIGHHDFSFQRPSEMVDTFFMLWFRIVLRVPDSAVGFFSDARKLMESSALSWGNSKPMISASVA
jgi:hypothetical protein